MQFNVKTLNEGSDYESKIFTPINKPYIQTTIASYKKWTTKSVSYKTRMISTTPGFFSTKTTTTVEPVEEEIHHEDIRYELTAEMKEIEQSIRKGLENIVPIHKSFLWIHWKRSPLNVLGSLKVFRKESESLNKGDTVTITPIVKNMYGMYLIVWKMVKPSTEGGWDGQGEEDIVL